ncbi:hypothetical protein Tco_0004379 [Tanacetum coccineum]
MENVNNKSFNGLSKRFSELEQHSINLELALQQSQEEIKNDKAWKQQESNSFRELNVKYFEIQDLKAQLQDKDIAISELKKVIEKMKGKFVETKFEKSSVIRQLNAFKSQRQSILGKPATFSDSLAKKDFLKSKSVAINNVSSDLSNPVTAQILPQNVKLILKNTNVIAPGISQPKSLGKSAHAEEHGQKVDNLEDQSHQEFNIGNDDETSVQEALDDDESQWNQSSSLTPDREWHKTKTVDNRPPQPWITQMAQAAGTQSLFNEFLATPIDFSAFIMHRLKIDNMTQEVLTGPTYDLIKGTCKSVVELEYHLEEVFKATNDRHLEEIIVRRQDDQLYKFREGDFKRLHRQDIEDMLLLLVQDKLTNLNLEERYALNVALQMFTRRIVIQEHVEDLQLGVKSYQKKINLIKPNTYRSDLKRMTPYTAYPDIQGIIYEDEMNRNRLMRTDELHKFSDGTLTHVRTALNDIDQGIDMEYFPKRKWSKQDKQRARVMIKAIDRKLRDRRLMRNLEKFVGGRPYGVDLRLLERTI